MTPAVLLLDVASDNAAVPHRDDADDAARAHTPPKNLVYLEPFGNGLLYSLDYERLLLHEHLGLRAGASWFSWSVSDYGGTGKLTLVSFPLVASAYAGTLRHKLQIGLGATILYTVASTDTTGTSFGKSGLALAATAVLGYRYLPPDGGFTFGAGFTPLYRPGRFLPWGGVDAGWAF